MIGDAAREIVQTSFVAAATAWGSQMDSAPKAKKRRSLFGEALHRIAIFLVAMCIGVAGTLAWQSPGSAPTKQRMANWAQQQGWTAVASFVAPKADKTVEQPSPPAQGAAREEPPRAASAAPIPPASSSHEVQQLEALARDLAGVRQNIEQLTTDQQQLAPGQRQMAADQKQLGARQEQMATDLKQLAARLEETAADQKRLAARQEQTATDLKDRIAAGQEQVAREMTTLQTAVQGIQRRRSYSRQRH
jgi:hypothetical protein